MPNYHSKPGADHARLGSFRATAGEDLAAGDVVFVSAREGRRKVVSKAGALSDAAGRKAQLFVCVGGATSGERVLVTDPMLVTNRNAVTKVFSTIAALSGGSLGDPVYLSDTPGAITLTPPTYDRIIGTYVDDYSWEFGNVPLAS